MTETRTSIYKNEISIKSVIHSKFYRDSPLQSKITLQSQLRLGTKRKHEGLFRVWGIDCIRVILTIYKKVRSFDAPARSKFTVSPSRLAVFLD